MPVNVFISGSMTYNKLTKNTKKMLNHLMDKNCHFLVGDCDYGVDNNVLGYLANPEGRKPYSDVTVYGSTQSPRADNGQINVQNGTWNYQRIGGYGHVDKDIAMGDKANAGVGIVLPRGHQKRNGQPGRISVGTLRNMTQLITQGKPAFLFYSQNNELKNKKLSSVKDLDQVISSYHDNGLSAKYKSTRDQELKRLGAYKAPTKHVDKDNDGPNW